MTTVIACVWSLAASVSADAQTRSIDLPRGPLAGSITLLARQTGASIGAPQGFPSIIVPAVRGRMDTATALRRLLNGTGLRAQAVAQDVWRISHAPVPPPALRYAPVAPPIAEAAADIVVTATKRGELAGSAAVPLTILDADDLAAIGDAPDTAGVARALNGLTVTNLGPGRNRLFVRGIADSPFDGFSQSSVSVQVDEARITYDAPDPQLRLIDMAQVELLKGPQGPLYGTGSLGGVYRLVPAKPDLTAASASVRGVGVMVQDGAASGSLDAVLDLPIVRDHVGVRAVGYRVGQGGWIDTIGGTHNANRGATSGGRIGLRARAGADWTLDVQAIAQSSSIADSQYVEGRDTLKRTARLPEPQDTDVTVISATGSGSIGTLHFTATASTSRQELQASYDASAKATLLGGVPPAIYRDQRQYGVTTGEMRVTGARGALDWLAGASYLAASTDAQGTLAAVPILTFHREAREIAGFGEATWHFAHAVRATAGMRVFQSSIDDERRERLTGAAVSRATLRASPSATLAWQPSRRLLAFLRYASALRPGGIERTRAGQPAVRYEADELQAFDLGIRWSSPDHRLILDGGAFRSRWNHVQADVLGVDGLVTTRNAGDAGNLGIDVTLGWRPDPRWSMSAGLLAQHARIRSDATGTPGDRRLPIVPDLTAHGELSYHFEIGDWSMGVSGRASYVGETRLSFDPGLNRESEVVTLVSSALTAQRGKWTVRAAIDNLGNSHADSFAFGNPFTIDTTSQHTPVQPRTASLSLQREF